MAKKSILELLTRDLVVNSRNGDLETVIATGAVDLTQGSRKGRGERSGIQRNYWRHPADGNERFRS